MRDQRVMQRVEADRQRRRLLERQAVGDRHRAAVVGNGIFGEHAAAAAHHALARLEHLGVGAARHDLAGKFEAGGGADSSLRPMRHAAGHVQVGSVDAGRPHPHQHLMRLRLRLRDVADLEALRGDDGGFHGVIFLP